MLFRNLENFKPMPHFIQDFGVYNAKREIDIPTRIIKNPVDYNSTRPQKNNNENVILEYLKLIKEINKQSNEIKRLENKKNELANIIMNNSELKNMLEKMLSDTIVKTK